MKNSQNLHQEFVRLGSQRHKLTKELCALLPQICEKEIYKKEGYVTIYEYAGKIAGLSKSVVQKVLQTEKHLKGKPHLQAAVKSHGIHKVALVARLATPETDRFFADKTGNMSKGSLFEFAREIRGKQENDKLDMNLFNCSAIQPKINLELDEEMQFLFLKLKNKLGKNLSNKEVMRQILKKLAEQEFNRKTRGQIALKVKNFPGKKIANTKKHGKITGRYINVRKKQEVLTRSGEKCEYPGCSNPIEVFHHTERFAVKKNHDSVKALCRKHHEFAHNGLIRNETSDPKNWKISIKNSLKNTADIFYQKHRKKALL